MVKLKSLKKEVGSGSPTLLGAVEAHHGATEAHPGATGAGKLQTHNGNIEAHPGALRLTLEPGMLLMGPWRLTLELWKV